MKVVGMMSVYNEADIVGQVIRHLDTQGIELVVIDNGSTDGSYEISRQHIGKGVLSLGRMETEKWENESIVRTLHAMAIQHSPDWVLLTAADEFLESPYRGLTLKRAIQLEGERGHNMIQFNNFEFFPTEKDHDSQESDVRKRLRYYSWHDDHQFRCWRTYPGMTVFQINGHNDKLPDGIPTKVSPNKFILRHYRIRSYEQGLRKVFRERLLRYSPAELAKGWHVHYKNLRPARDYFVIDSTRVTRYNEDGNWNLVKTFDGSFGAWNPPSTSEKRYLLLRIGRRIPLGPHIRKRARALLSSNSRLRPRQFPRPRNHENHLDDFSSGNRENPSEARDLRACNTSTHVTVLIPVYNRANFITEALESVYAQDYHDWDVVVVDDESTDDTVEVIKSQTLQNQITLVQIEHTGCAGATSVGIERASGPIVTILDSDDKLMYNSLSTVVPYFEKNQRLGYVWTNWVESSGDRGGGDYLPAGKTLFEALMSGWWKGCAQRFFRKEFYMNTPRLDPSVKYAVDFQLALLIAKTGCETLHIPKVTYWHRLHPHGMGVEHHDEQAKCILLLRDRFSDKNRLGMRVRCSLEWYRLRHMR